jgi:antitoxin ParD1/3/4
MIATAHQGHHLRENDSSCQFVPGDETVAMTSMNVSLPEELKEFVEAQAKQGYSTPSEYVRELIRRDQKRRAKERLEALLLEGLDSGEPIVADAAFWAGVRREAVAKLRARGKTARK